MLFNTAESHDYRRSQADALLPGVRKIHTQVRRQRVQHYESKEHLVEPSYRAEICLTLWSQ